MYNLIQYNTNDYKQQSKFNIVNIQNFKAMEVNENRNHLAIYSIVDMNDKSNEKNN